MLNDPVLLRLGENHFWLSLSDSDILLWAQGVAVNSGLNVIIEEPDEIIINNIEIIRKTFLRFAAPLIFFMLII